MTGDGSPLEQSEASLSLKCMSSFLLGVCCLTEQNGMSVCQSVAVLHTVSQTQTVWDRVWTYHHRTLDLLEFLFHHFSSRFCPSSPIFYSGHVV